MKQAFLALKLPIFILLFFAVTTPFSAQNCYQSFLEEGVRAFNSFQFETAIKKFEAAKVCTDRPETAEADDWLAKAQNGYIDRLQLIASRYLTSEGQRAFQSKNYGSAFRLYQEALKYKSDNTLAKNLQEQMLLYMADYQYSVGIDPRFYNPKQVVLPNTGLLVVFDENKENKNIQIKLINPGTREIKQIFELEGSPSNYQFSKDKKWLAVEFYNVKKQKVNLLLWDVVSRQLIHTFDEIYISDAYKAFAFSDNSEKLVYRSEEIIEHITYKTNAEDNLVVDTLEERGYSLNVYDLHTQKSIYTTGAIVDYFSDAQGDGSSDFRSIPMRQNLINEKISLKFSTQGVITTNNENFVLKENEFRIRTDYDFDISPDGKKFSFHRYGEEQKTEINFNSEVRITVGTPPKSLFGNISVINLENGSSIFSAKSEYEELLQRFLPFSFSKNSNHFIFINNRKFTGSEFFNFDEETGGLKSGTDHFLFGFNIYNFEQEKFYVENEQKIYDYFLTENNLLVAWAEDNAFAGKSGELYVYDLNADTLLFRKLESNDFSHFYDVKSEKELVYFSTFNSNTLQTTLNVLDTDLDSITALNLGFANLKYTYVRNSSDLKRIAFLTDNGYSIKVWDLKTQKQIREVKCQSLIEEFDFSNDANFLIIRDENNLVKIIDLKIADDLYDYFDNYLEHLTAEEREQIGIDW